MSTLLLSPRLAYAIKVASIWGLSFGILQAFFFFGSILLVQGHGSAPAVTHLTVGIMERIGLLFGVEPSFLFSAAFLSSILFLFVFLCALVLYRGRDRNNTSANRQSAVTAILLFLAFGLFVGASVTRNVETHVSDLDEARNSTMAIEFVRGNAALVANAGDPREMVRSGNPLRVYVGQPIRNSHNDVQAYEIVVEGLNRFYAIVETTGSTTTPGFRLICTTTPIPVAEWRWGSRIDWDLTAKSPCER